MLQGFALKGFTLYKYIIIIMIIFMIIIIIIIQMAWKIMLYTPTSDM